MRAWYYPTNVHVLRLVLYSSIKVKANSGNESTRIGSSSYMHPFNIEEVDVYSK